MGWKVWGERIDTADFAGSTPRLYQPLVTNRHLVLKGIRTWLIEYNNPTLTSLTLRIYADRAGIPGKLLYESSALTKSAIFTQANGVREAGFTFPQLPALQSATRYHVVLWGVGYTGDETSHLAWRRGWPDPVYTAGGVSSTAINVLVFPFALTLVGAELEA